MKLAFSLVSTTKTAIFLGLARMATTNALDGMNRVLLDYNYTTFSASIEAAGLTNVLFGASGPWTLFAPTNAAFENLPVGALEYLLYPENQGLLSQVVEFHVTQEAEYLANDLFDGQLIVSLLTNKGYVVTKDDETTKVGESTLEYSDILFAEGVIHGMSEVMIPATVEFPMDIPSSLLEAGNFTYLLAALEKAGLTDELIAPNGPFTLFAPTDDAFAKVPSETLDGLTDEALQSFLLFHVLQGQSFSSNLEDGMMVEMLNGQNATVSFEVDGNDTIAMINDAVIISADNSALNGVIHYLDTVLVPPLSVTEKETLDDVAPSDPPVDVPAEESSGSSMDVPPQLLGPHLGDSKLSQSSIGTCAFMDIESNGDYTDGLRLGWCQDLTPPVNIFPGNGGLEAFGTPELGSQGKVMKYECVECTDRDVIQNNDGVAYAEKFGDFTTAATACGRLYIYSETAGQYQCQTFKTSLLVPNQERQRVRGLRETSKHGRQLQDSPIVLNTMTYGTYKDIFDDVVCPADAIFDKNDFDETPEAVGTFQLVSQQPGDALDPSNWYCTSSS